MHIIVLYGAPATGKYTVGKAVAENLGYKLFHNTHLTVEDTVAQVLTILSEDK